MSQQVRRVVAALVVWTLLHTYLLMKGYLARQVFDTPFAYDGFYPFPADIENYDVTEYFVYVIGIWTLFFLYRFLTTGNRNHLAK